MQKRYRGIVTAVLAACCIFGLTDSTSVYAVEKQTVRIGYIDYEGFITEAEDGSYEGYGVEYLQEIAEHTNWEYEYVYDSWENQLENLKTGEIDFVCHAQKTPEREEEYLFSKYSIGSEASVLYVREDDERYYYNDFENFNGMTIAVLEGSFQSEEFAHYAQKKGAECQYVSYESPEECFQALDEGSVDAVALGSLSLMSDYKIICRFGAAPFYFMTGKGNQQLLDELDDALGEITSFESSFQGDLYEKYYGEMAARQELILTREEAEYIAQENVIEVAFIPSRRPFSYIDENGNLAGIVVDIMRLLEERSGLTFEYTMMPTGMRTSEYLENNPDAFVAGVMSDNPDFRLDPYLLTDYFYTDDVALVCVSGKEYDLNAGNQSYKLTIPRSYAALENYIRRNYPQFEIMLCADTAECLDMVLSQEADFAAQNVNVLKPYLSNPHYEGMTIVPTFFMEENMGLVSLDSEENILVTDILNRAMRTITSKELAQFTVDHTVANAYRPTWGDMVYRYRYPFIAIGVLAMAVVILGIAFSILRRKNYNNLQEKNEQLAQAVAHANHANRAKSDFLARMSHEIRTPMNAIVGLTELARHHSAEPEQMEEYLDKIETSSKVLLGIINDVLDMSAIESDKLKIAQKPFVLLDILKSINVMYSAQCKPKGIVFEMDATGVKDGCLRGDALRLNQVLLNLVSNAYKFTPEGGKITVTAKEVSRYDGKAYYKFCVADTGEGMTPEMLGRLFQPFEQEGADTAQKHGGSGLGLSIAKNLVELMGGSITCQSEKGKGTVFTVSVPFEVDEEQECIEQPACAKEVSEEDTKEQSPTDVYDFTGYTVLLVEDTEINAEIAKELLALVNMNVDHVWNGKEAVEKFAATEPGTYAAVLMDVQMPVMNGYEAVRAIRALDHPDASTMPIYAMTANAFTEDVSAALNAGMNGHLAKPIETETLYRILRKVIRNKQ